jgi:serine carboxypeptidase-like clade 2
MRRTTTFFVLSLTILLGTSVAAVTDVSQEAQLRKFMSSRALKKLTKRAAQYRRSDGVGEGDHVGHPGAHVDCPLPIPVGA